MKLRDFIEKNCPNFSKEELCAVPSSFDIIGSREKAVAILELPEGLKGKEHIVGEALMKLHKNVKSVLLKKSPRKGTYRTRSYRLIAGEKNTEVVHKEHGCRFLLDPRTCYFSEREGEERLRIAKKVKKGESVMVFFAGVGPYPIVVSKKSEPGRVTGIEMNPRAVKYFQKNVKMNKVENVIVVKGDVKDKSKEFYGVCDRVVMPLPENGIDFLGNAFNCLKPKGTCHFYFFSEEAGLPEWYKRINDKAKKFGKKVKIMGKKKVLPYGPHIWKWRIDIKLP
jgi:tRNA (guanine37-N1)-methyltransferase